MPMSGPDVVNDFEAWATISSRLFGKTQDEQRNLLTELGLTEVWKNANLAWAKALASDIVDMRLDRPRRYAEICARVLDREAELALLLTASDELSGQTTMRMRAHRAPDLQSFVESLSSGRAVEAPRRNQARTQLVDRSLIAAVIDQTTPMAELDEPLDAPLDESGETSLMRVPVLGYPEIIDASAWSLEHYARYVAEQDAGHESAEAIDDRYGVARDAAGAIRRSWNERLAADTVLKSRYDALVSEFLDTLDTARR